MEPGGVEREAVRFTTLGVRVEARSEDGDVRAALSLLLGGFAPSEAGGPADVVYSIERDEWVWRLFRDDDVVRVAELPLSLLHWLVHDLNRIVIERTTHVTLHAGGVTRHGAVILPGKMESGKTTLTAGLVRAGLPYLSDEAVGLDRETGFALPYPKPFSLDTGAQGLFPEVSGFDGGFESQRHVPPSELGSVGDPCPVRLVIFPRYESGASTSISRLGRAEALVELAENTFRFSARPRQSLDVLANVVRVAPCYRLVTGDLAPAVAAVLDMARVPPPSVGAAA